LIGACLISLYDEWPLVYDISVHPSYRGSQLASKMLKKALTVLHTNYPLLRLYVTIGNGAQSVYYKLGFVSGVESKRFYIPVLNAY
jgi:ribosomal protein S18 acetylase RimI-like enzyme